jgi:hypothetical protein
VAHRDRRETDLALDFSGTLTPIATATKSLGAPIATLAGQLTAVVARR